MPCGPECLSFTHAHFSASYPRTTCPAMHTRDGQLQLCTTPTPLQALLHLKNPSLFQLRSKSVPIFKDPTPVQLHFDFNSIYEALHNTATPCQFRNPNSTPLQLRLRNALSPALELSISGAYTYTYAKMR
jgi:hypothetical protein